MILSPLVRIRGVPLSGDIANLLRIYSETFTPAFAILLKPLF